MRPAFLVTTIALSLALFFSGSASAGEPERQGFPIESILLRTALVVSDVERSKRFYTYGLGYEIAFDGAIERPDVYQKLQLAETRKVHFVVLRGATSVNGREMRGAMIGLLHVDNPPLPASDTDGLRTGASVMAIISSDIDEIHTRMREMQAEILLPPLLSDDATESEMVVLDPDGIRIHIIEMHVEE